MSRGDERYTAGVLAHIDINDYVKPYLQFGFMDDKTTINIAPSGLFQSNPTDPTGNGNFNINCSSPLLSAQEQSIFCTPAQIAAAQANPWAPCATPPNPVPNGYVSPNCANIIIGRRNVEGGPRVAYWDHTNYRAVRRRHRLFADGWSYDAYGQYYTTTLFNSNSNYINLASVDNALQVSGTAGEPNVHQRPTLRAVEYFPYRGSHTLTDCLSKHDRYINGHGNRTHYCMPTLRVTLASTESSRHWQRRSRRKSWT